ncbi:MAG TPA: response regulator [Thermoanaerobaculia bacterium]|nr:response regulator [Thermoanaerobaculia bacterium]
MPDEKRILVVDDDPAIRTLLFTVLRRKGLPVDTAKHGGDAIDKLARCRYALMLLDLMMPVMNGWEVLASIVQIDAAYRPLVILMTAGNEPRDFDPGIVIGSVRKPFDVQLMYDTIAGCISVLAPRPQLPGCPPPQSTPDALS